MSTKIDYERVVTSDDIEEAKDIIDGVKVLLSGIESLGSHSLVDNKAFYPMMIALSSAVDIIEDIMPKLDYMIDTLRGGK